MICEEEAKRFDHKRGATSIQLVEKGKQKSQQVHKHHLGISKYHLGELKIKKIHVEHML